MATRARSSEKIAREQGAEEVPPLDERETAAYIADMTRGLRVLAKRAHLNFLAYLLDMAASESLDRSGRR